MSTSINKLLNAALTETLLNEEEKATDILNVHVKDPEILKLGDPSSPPSSYLDQAKDFYTDHKLGVGVGGTALAAGLGALALIKKLRNKKLAAAANKKK